ncbi:MAG: hypothetical protein IJE89_03165 [Bacilli bacterium]|nr:hypothetical protein [Bacilli bacterium]
MKNETRGRDIFYGVVAVATLIVAIVGATLAYFSISVSSNEGAVNAISANVSISYEDGQQVTAQADKLIPATLDIVKSVYEKKVKENNPENNPGNVCIDDKNQQVCSAYRFTVGSNVERTISATLNNEENGFTFLSYAVYDVDNDVWLKLDDENSELMGLSTCSNENDDTQDNCHSTDGNNVKTYSSASPKAVNSIFGYTVDGATTKYKTQPLEANGTRTFDLILFIKENDANQNIDQGKKYRGTIIVDVNDGTSNGQITGFLNQTTNG